MKIVQIANMITPVSGGLHTVVRHLAAGHRAAGDDVVLVRPRHPGEGGTSDDVVRLFGVSLPGFGGYRVLLSRGVLRQALDLIQPDAVEVHDRFTLPWVAEWAHDRDVPAVVVVHERLAAVARTWLPVPGATTVADALDRRLAKLPVPLVVPSRFAGAALREATVVPWGVDLTMFHPSRRVRGGDDSTLRLITVGRLSKEKSPLLAIETVRTLVRRGHDVHLDVVGDGPMRGHVARAARGLPVTVHGHVEDRVAVATMMADADVGLAVGAEEAFGLAALELLATGTPVVGPHRGGVVDVVTPEVGVLTDPDPLMLASAVTRLHERDPAMLRAACRDRATAFPWSRSVRAVRDLLGLRSSGVSADPDRDVVRR